RRHHPQMRRRRHRDELRQPLDQTEQRSEPQRHPDTLTSLPVRSLAWLLAFACSSGPGSPEHPRPPPPGDPTAPTAPSEPECDQLITHTVALGIDEQAARAEPHATASDHEAIRRALHEDFMAGCRALSRDAYR